ncbi:sterile alpha motif domain-containing protein 15 isoform X2 [Dasypus novemcinctus]|uniref:sterile alpha motif domain-containing protein 15 isoform X2 n=1 Tax=Dasypus novemcinctus TaxID=9361 RepID=UPI00265EF692|nr:sterile alpha motif domain-containing protein 15 isoform X2 [Dasypus novemcinctus]
MADVPDDYYSEPDEDEDRRSVSPTLSEHPKLDEDAEPDTTAEADPELLEVTDQEPQPETEEDYFKERPSENADYVQLKPARSNKEDIFNGSEIDLSRRTEPEILQEVKQETSREMGGELFGDLEIPMDEILEKEPELLPPEEVKRDVTEDLLIESAKETDLELPKETKPEVPGDTLSETRLDLEETEPEAPVELLREQYEETDLEPLEQTKPEFPSQKSKKSVEESDLQPPEIEETRRKLTEEKGIEPPEQTKPEFSDQKPRKSAEETGLETPEETKPEDPEESERKLIEKKGAESPQQTKLEFSDQKLRKSIEELSLEPPGDTKPEVPEEIQKKSTEEIETEPPKQAKSEFPDQKPGKSVEQMRRESIEGIPEPLEEIRSEFLKEESKKTIEETSVEPQGNTKTGRPRRKSNEKEIQELPENKKPVDQKEKSRKSSGEPGLVSPQKYKLQETLRDSNEEKNLEPPEHTKPEFPTEEAGHMPPQEIKPEAQEKILKESTAEEGQEFPDKAKPLFRRETHLESSKEGRREPIKFKYSEKVDELEHPKYQTIKKTKSKDSPLGSSKESEIELTKIDYEFSEKLQKPNVIYETISNSHSSGIQRDLRESFGGEKIVDLYQEEEELVPDIKETQPKETEQFACLKWSPEEVADWISQLGFPQYKECFTTNFISGRKLIHVNCANLPQMGITDFEDMKITRPKERNEAVNGNQKQGSRNICNFSAYAGATGN